MSFLNAICWKLEESTQLGNFRVVPQVFFNHSIFSIILYFLSLISNKGQPIGKPAKPYVAVDDETFSFLEWTGRALAELLFNQK